MTELEGCLKTVMIGGIGCLVMIVAAIVTLVWLLWG